MAPKLICQNATVIYELIREGDNTVYMPCGVSHSSYVHNEEFPIFSICLLRQEGSTKLVLIHAKTAINVFFYCQHTMQFIPLHRQLVDIHTFLQTAPFTLMISGPEYIQLFPGMRGISELYSHVIERNECQFEYTGPFPQDVEPVLLAILLRLQGKDTPGLPFPDFFEEGFTAKTMNDFLLLDQPFTALEDTFADSLYQLPTDPFRDLLSLPQDVVRHDMYNPSWENFWDTTMKDCNVEVRRKLYTWLESSSTEECGDCGGNCVIACKCWNGHSHCLNCLQHSMDVYCFALEKSMIIWKQKQVSTQPPVPNPGFVPFITCGVGGCAQIFNDFYLRNVCIKVSPLDDSIQRKISQVTRLRDEFRCKFNLKY